MDPIPSPYNFVPLSGQVFFPEWSAQVSHDVPFEDGISGWFEVEVEATTAIYVRNGGDHTAKTKEERRRRLDNADWQSFFRVSENGEFAIPGSSLKGMLRAVMEQACFAKMTSVDNRRRAVRDLNTRDEELYKRHLTAGNRATGFYPRARAGWLKLNDGGQCLIYPCEMARVEQEDLEAYALRQGRRVFLGAPQKAGDKYDRWPCSLDVACDIDDTPMRYPHSEPLLYRKASNLRPGNDGVLIFTGQAQAREPGKARRKHMEFVFFERKSAPLAVEPSVREDFLFIHSDDHGEYNDELKSLLKRFGSSTDGIPVFFLSEGTSVSAIGLALMFRLPYRFTARDLVESQQAAGLKAGFLDLPETVFGHTGDEQSLRGRVHPETMIALAGTAREFSAPVVAALGNPKPTFYPNYLEQRIADEETGEIEGKYVTYMNATPAGSPAGRVRGWKSYPARPDGSQPEDRPLPTDKNNKVNLDIITKFRPLEAGVRFRGKIRVHNLLPTELGALLWTLTLDGREKLRHRIGMAKPLGYGNVQLRLTGELKLFRADVHRRPVSLEQARDCVQQFTACMDRWCQTKGLGSWRETPQVKAVLAMADPALPWLGSRAEKWRSWLAHPGKPKDFAGYKIAGLALLPVAQSAPPSSMGVVESERPPAKPPPAPPKILPDLTGQQKQVSFQRSQDVPDQGQELWFRLKLEKEKFDAVLRNPARTDLRAPLTTGQAFKLWVTGQEAGHYLLAESLEEAGE